jgi:hypothetical protein
MAMMIRFYFLLLSFSWSIKNFFALQDNLVYSIEVRKDQCLGVLVIDGFQIKCADTPETFQIFESNCKVYQKLSFVLFEKFSGIILNYSKYIVPKHVNEMYKENTVNILWPRFNEVISTNQFDVHFLLPANSSLSFNASICLFTVPTTQLICAEKKKFYVPLNLPNGKYKIKLFLNKIDKNYDQVPEYDVLKSLDIVVSAPISNSIKASRLDSAPYVFGSQFFSDALKEGEVSNLNIIHVAIMSVRSMNR